MSGYTALLGILLIVSLVALHCTASKGACFKKYNERKGCWSKDRGLKKVKYYDCCKTHQGGGWTASKQDRKSCTPCKKRETVTSTWSVWGPWGACNATCGVSVSVRRRNCKVSSGPPKCKGSNEEKRPCSVPHCPIDGGWSDWSDWTHCSVTCGKGIQYRRRACDNPAPRHGGSECKGSLEKSRNCVMSANCPIHGGWGEWGRWSGCSKTCDIGNKERRRPCDNPKPQFGGRPCNESEAVDIDYCREERCVITSGDYSGSGSGNGWGSGSGSGDNYSGESGDGWENSGSGSGSATGSGSGSGSGSGAGGSGSGSSDGGSRRRRRSRRNLYFPDEE